MECLDVVRPYLFEFNERERVNVRVTVDCEDDPQVAVDTAGLREAIVNLLTNAIDASASGGDIVIRVGRERQEAFVSVVDHGVGMDAGTRQRAFDPFFSTKSRRSAGLGLPLCLSVVESHGGRLAVASTHGVGSTFTVWLPVADEPEQLPGVASSRPPGPIA